MADEALNLLGLARRGKHLELGEEPVAAAARAHKARLILTASDAGASTAAKARRLAESGNGVYAPLNVTKAELGRAVGWASCAVAAVTDVGLAAAVMKKLAAQDPAAFGESLALLEEKAAKAQRRRKETRQHEKNLRRGKKKNPVQHRDETK